MNFDSTSKLTIKNHISSIGATIDGIDLENTKNTETLKALFNAFTMHRLVVLKRQRLTVKQQIKFSRLFGPLENFPTPEDRAEGNENVLRVTNIERDSNKI